MVDILKRLIIIVGLITIGTLSVPMVLAGPTDDNHIHVEQVGSADDVSLTINQLGFGNTVEFSFAHQGNTFNLTQNGSGNKISWVPYWGSGKSWGGDVDGSDNTETVELKSMIVPKFEPNAVACFNCNCGVPVT